ncbi:MAG: redoxin domain-containing protein [Candidatus Sungbacteria bacterium]|uniref:Redoxin domain-containing protein n=1 Tax=Candidatus Sungiibacteriota bacterium TaxID=2750080 RepID=A0A9D6LRA2_9BACT|nr:redoxin domain-containing protein [Candidatus Sungbacteria bacterium]
MLTKNVVLGIALVLIIGTIWYFETGKIKPASNTRGEILASNLPGSASAVADASLRRAEKAKKYGPAREITPGGGFINGGPFRLKDFIGKKVILLDFWTYSCINCQRTTPYLNAWYAKYKDRGLVIVGVHTPEFDFEKVYDNVVKGTRDLGITYPVVQDNNYATWQTYENQYWPHEYLIDIDGYIVHDHIGEGGYDETERAIQAALKEREQVLGTEDNVSNDITNPADVIQLDSAKVQSPETYFGSARNEYLGNGAQGVTGVQQLLLPSPIQPNMLYLDGSWDFKDQYAKSQSSNAKMVFRYSAKNVYFVASASEPVKITVMEDGEVVSRDRGSDVSPDGTVVIQANRLYKLISGSDYGQHTLEIMVNSPGLQAYTLTFG